VGTDTITSQPAQPLPAAPEDAAPVPASTRKFVARCEEWVFFTEVCRLDEYGAMRALGISDRAALRVKRHLRANPAVRAEVLAFYRGGSDGT
jgi:hypothetical protein